MDDNMPLLRPLAIAAGGLGCVSINNNVIFTYLKHLEINTVQVANSVKCLLFLFYRPSVYFTFLNLTSAPDYSDATEHVRFIFVIKRCLSVSLPPSCSRPNLTFERRNVTVIYKDSVRTAL
jgi:hypothetical protein